MDGDCIVETPNKTHKCHQFMKKKTLQFLVLVSVFSFLYSYLSGFPFFSYHLQFPTLVFPLFAHMLDRKYMFLICNAILVFLANNLKISSSTLNYCGFMKSAEDGVKQIAELPPVLIEERVEENVETVQYATEKQTGQEQEEEEDLNGGSEEINTQGILLESDQDLEEEEDDEELIENRVVEVNDARVSTEELNNKFEEFIRKMKEEIRIEAQQPLVTV